MNRNMAVGTKIKQLRQDRKLTLKVLSESSGLSVGFLSQLERGISSIAIDSLEKLADILEVDLGLFFKNDEQESASPVTYGVELQPNEISESIYQYMLCGDAREFELLPRIFMLMPTNDNSMPEMYSHNGEEFIYVLEGIVTVFIENSRYVIYPGDSVQIHSNHRHNWANRTNKVARILTVNTPNPFKENHKTHPSQG